jgi:hypothetical protein
VVRRIRSAIGITNACSWNGTPALARDLGLIVVGGGSRDEVDNLAVLQGIDLETGQSRFQTKLAHHHPVIVEGSEPRAMTLGGSIVFVAAVYRHNLDGRLIVVDATGATIWDHVVEEDDGPFRRRDIGTKLWTGVESAPAVAGGVVFTYAYRSHDTRFSLYVIGESAPRWVGDERTVRVVGDVVVGTSGTGDAVVSRDLHNGGVVMREDLGTEASVAAVSDVGEGGFVFLVDRSDQADRWARKQREVDAEVGEERIAFEAAWERSNRHPGGRFVVRALDAATGRPRWLHAFEGDLLDVRSLDGFGATAVAVSTPRGEATCHSSVPTRRRTPNFRCPVASTMVPGARPAIPAIGCLARRAPACCSTRCATSCSDSTGAVAAAWSSRSRFRTCRAIAATRGPTTSRGRRCRPTATCSRSGSSESASRSSGCTTSARSRS